MLAAAGWLVRFYPPEYRGNSDLKLSHTQQRGACKLWAGLLVASQVSLKQEIKVCLQVGAHNKVYIDIRFQSNNPNLFSLCKSICFVELICPL